MPPLLCCSIVYNVMCDLCSGLSTGIYATNSVYNVMRDLCSGLSTGIYATNSADACRSIAAAAECVVIVVENDNQLQKILKVWDQLPLLRAVVQYKGIPQVHHGRSIYSVCSALLFATCQITSLLHHINLTTQLIMHSYAEVRYMLWPFIHPRF